MVNDISENERLQMENEIAELMQERRYRTDNTVPYMYASRVVIPVNVHLYHLIQV